MTEHDVGWYMIDNFFELGSLFGSPSLRVICIDRWEGTIEVAVTSKGQLSNDITPFRGQQSIKLKLVAVDKE